MMLYVTEYIENSLITFTCPNCHMEDVIYISGMSKECYCCLKEHRYHVPQMLRKQEERINYHFLGETSSLPAGIC